MKRLLAVLAAMVLLLALAPSPTSQAASTLDTHKCVGSTGGDILNGWWYGVRCSGVRFKTNAHKYRAVVVCDRALWQADVTRYGSWQWGNATSYAVCSAVGDLGIVRKFYQST